MVDDAEPIEDETYDTDWCNVATGKQGQVVHWHFRCEILIGLVLALGIVFGFAFAYGAFAATSGTAAPLADSLSGICPARTFQSDVVDPIVAPRSESTSWHSS